MSSASIAAIKKLLKTCSLKGTTRRETDRRYFPMQN